MFLLFISHPVLWCFVTAAQAAQDRWLMGLGDENVIEVENITGLGQYKTVKKTTLGLRI